MPNPDFAASLRGSLLTAAASRPTPHDPTPSTPAFAATSLPAGGAATAPRPIARAFAFAAVSLLLIGILTGNDRVSDRLSGAASSLFGGTGNSDVLAPSPISIPALAIATPSPTTEPFACTAPITDLQSLAATVNALPERTPSTVASATPRPYGDYRPADTATTAAVTATVQSWFACAHAGETTRMLGLYTDDLLVRLFSSMGSEFEWSPELTPEPATPRPASEQVTIERIGPFFVLPDGRVSVEAVGSVAENQMRTQMITFYLIQESGQWLIDDFILTADDGTIETTETGTSIPATPASPEPAPSMAIHIVPNFPDGAPVESRMDPVILWSVPRIRGQVVAQRSAPRSLVITGPVVDSGDSMWVGVTDAETGDFGYQLVGDLVPPGPRPSNSAIFGNSLVSTAPIMLRAAPDLAVPADPPLPAGTRLMVNAETTSDGLAWLSVVVEGSDGEHWILPDTLAVEPTGSAAASLSPNPAFPPDATVTVRPGGETVILRALPRTHGEDIAHLPGEREMRVAGPMADSGDNLWLPVIDAETGVFGYVPIDLVTPADSAIGFPIDPGTTYRVATDVQIRPEPEAASKASVTLAPGNDLVVVATSVSRGVPWVQVTVASSDVTGWLPVDILTTSAYATGMDFSDAEAAVGGPRV